MSRYLYPIILIILSVGLFFTFTEKRYSEAQSLIAEIEQYDATLEKARELQTLQEDLISRYNNFSGDDIEKLEKLLPSNVDNVRLIIEIESIAEAHDITLESVTVTNVATSNETNTNTTQSSGVKTVDLQIATTAEYEVFLDFLDGLEKSLRIVDIENTDFSSGGISVEEYGYAITLRTYWLE